MCDIQLKRVLHGLSRGECIFCTRAQLALGGRVCAFCVYFMKLISGCNGFTASYDSNINAWLHSVNYLAIFDNIVIKFQFPITALREIRILQLLKHENVVNLLEICRTKGTCNYQ